MILASMDVMRLHTNVTRDGGQSACTAYNDFYRDGPPFQSAY